ncbi:MAG: hypothetical protein QXF01_00415 [Candidatus Micrarchaeaceae archaeon]
MLLLAIGVIAYFVLILMLAYRLADSNDRLRWRKLASLVAFVALGFLLFRAEGASVTTVAELIPGILVFNGIISNYGRVLNFAYILISIVYIISSYAMGISLLEQALLFGMLSAIMTVKTQRGTAESRQIEARRDLIQIAAGVIFICAFLLLPSSSADLIVFLVVIAGILLINYARVAEGGKLSGMLYSIERKSTPLGLGAMWLAIGTLISISFIRSPYVVVALSAMFIGDSMASIVGMGYGKAKLPYNKKKSAAGLLAYFIPTLAISYFIIGSFAIPIALAAAFVESLPISVDDNFSVSLIVTALLLGLGHISGIFHGA